MVENRTHKPNKTLSLKYAHRSLTYDFLLQKSLPSGHKHLSLSHLLCLSRSSENALGSSSQAASLRRSKNQVTLWSFAPDFLISFPLTSGDTTVLLFDSAGSLFKVANQDFCPVTGLTSKLQHQWNCTILKKTAVWAHIFPVSEPRAGSRVHFSFNLNLTGLELWSCQHSVN